MKKKWLWWVLIVLGVGLGLIYWGARYLAADLVQPAAPAAQAAASDQPERVQVEVAPVRAQRLAQQVTAVGSLLAKNAVVLRAETSGRIAQIRFEEGSPAQKGTLLVQLDTDLLQAELQQAQANLQLAQSRARRAQQLSREGFISAQALDESTSERSVALAQANIIKTKIEKSQIVAPFDGVLGLRHVSVGDYVNMGTEIVALASIEELQVDFRVPELYLSQIQVGTPIHLRLDAQPDTEFLGQVNAISPMIDEQGRAVVLRAHVPNPELKMRPGQFARLTIDLAEEEALMVPETALSPSGQAQYVYRLQEGDAVQRVEVTVGTRKDGWVQVQGLVPTDVVLTSGLQKVQTGTLVQYDTMTAQP
ncbi:efflux RND transporter periplasmic adaptor subunit [Paenalcaligenes hominis]|uniref:efflux RND transporter periplasmic adaptor subunit n=1 Tax=Paenalcaligenes hominis TaxID=643674 RepID=UPI00352392C6